MPSGYQVTVTTYSGGTGHVNITLTGPGGVSHTFGSNTQGLTWGGVQREGADDPGFNPNRVIAGQVTMEISEGQFNSMLTLGNQRDADTAAGYGLFGENCVDFVRTMLEAASLGNSVSAFMTGVWYAPVYLYAQMTDFMHQNGFGFILNMVGDALEDLGGVGNLIYSAGQAAWGHVMDGDFGQAVTSLFGGLASGFGALGSNIMGALGDFWNALTGNDDEPELPVNSSDPVIIDLDGDGLELIPMVDSQIVYQNGDGVDVRWGWVAPDDGILAFDADGDGIVDGPVEFELSRYLQGAQTDLEGLSAFDSNQDGVFDAADEDFDRFLIWRDLDSDGICDAGEAAGLNDLGVASIDLGLNGDRAVIGGNLVHNTTTVTLADGSTRMGYDVAFLGYQAPSLPVDDGYLI